MKTPSKKTFALLVIIALLSVIAGFVIAQIVFEFKSNMHGEITQIGCVKLFEQLDTTGEPCDFAKGPITEIVIPNLEQGQFYTHPQKYRLYNDGESSANFWWNFTGTSGVSIVIRALTMFIEPNSPTILDPEMRTEQFQFEITVAPWASLGSWNIEITVFSEP